MIITNNKLVNYVKASYSEMRKVTWPTKETTIKLTWVVVLISLFVAAFLGSLDFGFSQVVKKINSTFN